MSASASEHSLFRWIGSRRRWFVQRAFLRRTFGIASLALLFTGCTAEAPPPKAPPPEPKVAEDLPTWCTGGEKPCRPTRDFAARLCRGRYPGAALFLFQKSSPWQARWIKAKDHDGHNGEGGPSGGPLEPVEEVRVMAYDETPAAEQGKGKNAPKTNVSLVVLRWDGTCATIAARDTATAPPATPKHAVVRYSDLDASVQRSLSRDPDIKSKIDQREKTCTSATSPECQSVERELSSLIVNKIRRGLKLSMPDFRP
ncbi:MAG: hypothetical protein QM784_03590 [Polyangiaceae bacterium]